MHARDDATTGDERTKYRKEKSADYKSNIPLPQHSAFFLHHDRMQERGVHQPWQQRRVLDGVPCPVSAPAELDVRPPHADHGSHSIEEPGEERPTPDGGEPFGIETPRQ